MPAKMPWDFTNCTWKLVVLNLTFWLYSMKNVITQVILLFLQLYRTCLKSRKFMRADLSPIELNGFWQNLVYFIKSVCHSLWFNKSSAILCRQIAQFLFKLHNHNELNSDYISVIGSDIERVSMIGLPLSVFNWPALPSKISYTFTSSGRMKTFPCSSGLRIKTFK